MFILLTQTENLSPVFSNVISVSLAILVSFFLNHYFTFHVRSPAFRIQEQFCRFVCVKLLLLGLSTGIVWSFSMIVPAVVAKIIAAPVVTGCGFIAARTIVFRQKK
jgi:putative flippase GtrA